MTLMVKMMLSAKTRQRRIAGIVRVVVDLSGLEGGDMRAVDWELQHALLEVVAGCKEGLDGRDGLAN